LIQILSTLINAVAAAVLAFLAAAPVAQPGSPHRLADASGAANCHVRIYPAVTLARNWSYNSQSRSRIEAAPNTPHRARKGGPP